MQREGGDGVKVRIELLDDGSEDEVIIRCGRVDDTVQKIQQFIKDQTVQQASFTFYKDNQEFYFPVDRVLFFETEGEYVYAHTEKDSFRIKLRLYELEETLPGYFMRVSKSTILNTRHIYAMTKSLSASCVVEFKGTHKQVYVSRHYYKPLKNRLEEKR